MENKCGKTAYWLNDWSISCALRAYRAVPKVREYQCSEIKNMLERKFYKPATTEWAPSILFLSKTADILWLYVDYKTLNAITQMEAYRIRRMDECIDSSAESTVFFTLDTNSATWQLEIDNRDKVETASTS